jgi:hypothetical protein
MVILLAMGAVTVLLLTRVRHEVSTLKDQATIGALASEGETRRVGNIPRGDRTTQEQHHLDVAALEDAPHRDAPE